MQQAKSAKDRAEKRNMKEMAMAAAGQAQGQMNMFDRVRAPVPCPWTLHAVVLLTRVTFD